RSPRDSRQAGAYLGEGPGPRGPSPLRSLVAPHRHDRGHDASGITELDGDDAGITDERASGRHQPLARRLEVLDLDSEVMNAGMQPGGPRLGRVGLGVVLDEGQVDGPVGQMTGVVVPDPALLRAGEAEDRLVETGRGFQVP